MENCFGLSYNALLFFPPSPLGWDSQKHEATQKLYLEASSHLQNSFHHFTSSFWQHVSCVRSPDSASPDRAVSTLISWSKRPGMHPTLSFPKCYCSVCHRTGKVRIPGCILNPNGSWLCPVTSMPLATEVWALGSTNALIFLGKTMQMHLVLPFELSQICRVI